jgi:hypothetical protein
MVPAMHKRRVRLAAALFAVAALVSALHDALTHGAPSIGANVALPAASHESGTSEPELCPICLAAKNASGVPIAHGAELTPPLATIARLPAPPLLAARLVTGTASPRAPPSA